MQKMKTEIKILNSKIEKLHLLTKFYYYNSKWNKLIFLLQGKIQHVALKIQQDKDKIQHLVPKNKVASKIGRSP